MQGYRVTLERLMNVFQVIRCVSGNYVVCGWNKLTVTAILPSPGGCFGLSKNIHHRILPRFSRKKILRERIAT